MADGGGWLYFGYAVTVIFFAFIAALWIDN